MGATVIRSCLSVYELLPGALQRVLGRVRGAVLPFVAEDTRSVDLVLAAGGPLSSVN